MRTALGGLVALAVLGAVPGVAQAAGGCADFTAPSAASPKLYAHGVMVGSVDCRRARVVVRSWSRHYPTAPKGWTCKAGGGTSGYVCVKAGTRAAVRFRLTVKR